MSSPKAFPFPYLYRRINIVVHDLFMVLMAWTLAYLIRYDFSLHADSLNSLLRTAPFVLVIQALLLWWAETYRGLWRFASLPDLWNIIRASALGVLAIGLVLFIVNRMEAVPRSSLLLYPIILVFLLGAPRLVYRMFKDRQLGLHVTKDCKRVLVLGAGKSGELLIRDIAHDEYLPIGFLDDNKQLMGARIHGIPVLGTMDELPQIIDDWNIDAIVIAVPSATNAQMQRIVDLCEQTHVPFRTVPKLQDLVSGQSSLKEFREVAMDDLLGREPISLDWRRIGAGLRGKIVLVTGAGGSIGSELCRQTARLGVAALVLFERSEFNLYSIELELRQKYPNLILHACLGDICDQAAVDYVLATYRAEVIFHAAAYKHVPMLQEQAREAVRNNVLGTKIVALAATKYNCSTFILISTDKAVNPTSVMGTSKRIAEIFCQNLNRRASTHFITVRFGNVLGSAGSVVPLFQRQIAAGGPVTVTHPEMTRYFMTIPEASQLIMQASAMGEGGEIYVLNMGEAINITYLAELMIKLAGKTPGEDIQIVYTGLRLGEKLFEEIFHDQENLSNTGHDKILLAHCREMEWKLLDELLREIEQACNVYNDPAVLALLKKLVPELSEPEAENSPSNVINLGRINI